MPILLGQEYGDHKTSGWNLHTGTGDRYFDRQITFQSALMLPIVQVNLSKIDSEQKTNVRVEVLVANLTSYGFTLRIHTWADTILYSVRANWIAFAP